MTTSNPFINRPLKPESAQTEYEDEHSEENVELVHGPMQPLAQYVGSDINEAIPKQAISHNALIHVTSVHGGAGATTLCALLKTDVNDMRGLWGQPNPWVPSNRGMTLLVARAHGRGLSALHATLSAWHHGAYSDALPLLGVCIIDDAPRLTKAQSARIKTLMGMAPHTWHMPWIEAYRIETDELSISMGTKRLLNSIRKYANRLNMKGSQA